MDKQRIIINGREYTAEEIQQMQEEAEKAYWEQWEQLRKEYDCNCAVVADGPREFVIFCSIDRKMITNPNFCKNCAAYNNKDYSIEDTDLDGAE